METFVIQFGVLLSMCALAVHDLRSGKMPNWITLGSLLLALCAHGSLGGTHGAVVAIFGAVVSGAIPLGLFFFTRGRAIGGGDVKALFALGAWLGPVQGLEAEMLGFIFLALYALVGELIRGRGLALLRRSGALILPARWVAVPSVPPFCGGQGPEMLELKFGPALFLGTLVVCVSSLAVGAG